jgi:hypothetical protein
MTRKEDDVADIAVILVVIAKMAVLLGCVLCTDVYRRFAAIWGSFIFSDYGSRRFL